MYIRQTKIKNGAKGEIYFAFRIVESIREGRKIKQKTLLNLGKYFDIAKEHWHALTSRIEQLIQGQQELEFFDISIPLDAAHEAAAQRYATLIIQKQSQKIDLKKINPSIDTPDYQMIDINKFEALEPRSFGAENIAYHALSQIGLEKKLISLGFNSKELAATTGQIIARMVSPGSELHTHNWLEFHSALGELINHDFATTSLTRLYRVTDKLIAYQDEIEDFLYKRECDLFRLQKTIVLYDLTNTFFEGTAQLNPKAQFGRSKEKRSDCPLVTMGLVLDGDGFPMNSKIFKGNVSEAETLEEMLNRLTPKHNEQLTPPIVVMDAGIATEDNIEYLKGQNLKYIVVSRKRKKERPDEKNGAVVIKNDENNKIIAKRVDDKENGEVLLYCHSLKREKKDQAIRTRFHSRFEDAIEKLNLGLTKKGMTKKYEKIIERIGRIKQKYSRIAQEYNIDVKADIKNKNAISINWKRLKISLEKDDLSGVYCLRTNIMDWSESTLWNTYVMLTDLESTFRSMKTELGLRPVFHQKEDRVSAHLFITLLAYHFAHTLRYQLKQKNIHFSWQSLRKIMSRQHRITISAPTQKKSQIYVRTTTKAETQQQIIYEALGMKFNTIGTQKTIIGCH